MIMCIYLLNIIYIYIYVQQLVQGIYFLKCFTKAKGIKVNILIFYLCCMYINSMYYCFVTMWYLLIKVLTNDKYKSVWHRAVVNNTATRISIAVPHGPSVDTVVVPSPELLEREGQPPAYSGVSYKDYLELQHSIKSYMKPCLDNIRI